MYQLLFSVSLRLVLIIIGVTLLSFQMFRAIEWTRVSHDDKKVIQIHAKLQYATIALAVYIGLISLIVFLEQTIPSHPICLGLTCVRV